MLNRTHLRRYLGVLAVFVFLLAMGRNFETESRTTYTFIVLVIAWLALFVLNRLPERKISTRNSHARKHDMRPATDDVHALAHRVEEAPRDATVDEQILMSVKARRQVTVMIAVVYVALWGALVQLGAHSEAARDLVLAAIQVASAVIAGVAILVASIPAPRLERSSRSFVRRAVFTVVIVAGIGVVLVPLIALRVWIGFIDFMAYQQHMNLAWMYIPAAAAAAFLFRIRDL